MMTTDLLTNIIHHEAAFIQLIQARLGVVIQTHQTHELHKTILAACHQYDCSPAAYLKMLVASDGNSPILEHLVSGITVGETYFFRDKNHMQLLEKVLLPQLIELKRDEKNLTLRIWSAGCATGEEIYTIAMMLNEMLLDIKAWSLHLLATDINANSLKKAMKGLYSEWAMRAISSTLKEKYFKPEGKKYVLSEHIRNMAEFMYLNLNDNHYPSLINGTSACDLILCRNVLIYFDNDSTLRLMKKLSHSILETGYIMLGASDPILLNDTQLIYHPGKGYLSFQVNHNKTLMTSKVETASADIKKSKCIPTIAHLNTKKLRTSTNNESTISIPLQDKINQLMRDDKWHEILHMLKSYPENERNLEFAMIAKATALANIGALDNARITCIEGINLHHTNAQIHFIYAMVLSELNQLVEAESELRKTLFLDRNFVVGHFQLGLLLLRKKQNVLGIKCLNNALRIAQSKDPTCLVKSANNLNYGRLIEILTKEIELFSVKKDGKNALK